MAVQNRFFEVNSTTTIQRVPSSRKTFGREELLNSEIAEDLNTYKNFGIFHTRADVVVPKTDKNGYEIPADCKGSARAGAIGVRSIFNAYSAAVTGSDSKLNLDERGVAKFNTGTNGQATIETAEGMSAAWTKLVARMSDFRHGNNTPLMDTPETRRLLRQHNDISVRGLVEASKHGALSRTPYSYADFMYCKYLNRVPNNYLITLRRFANPVMDNIRPVGRGRKKADFNRSGLAHPIGTMVTWMGVSGNDMSNILKYDYSMAFEEKSAQWEQLNKEGGEGILNSLEAAINPSTRSMWQKGYTNNPLDEFVPGLMGNAGGKGPYSYPPPRDNNKVYGPIDRVKKNYRRSADGLNWNMKFTITFEYELRAYNGINPRQAMLDLLASILSVTYTSGGFWPGGYYGGGMGQSSTFRNLSIFKATGGFTNYMDALVHDMSTLGAKAQQSVQANGGLLETAKKVLNMIGGMLMGALINKLGRPAKYHAPSLLSEAPCGLWHITIGNPYRPIVSMGNMILLRTEVKHSGPLGLDDFPTNLTVTCEFDRGKPRDQYGVEAIYMNGNDRIYHGMSDKILDAYKAAQVYKKGNTPVNANGEQKGTWLDADPEGAKEFTPPEPEKTNTTTTNTGDKPNSATAKAEKDAKKETKNDTKKDTKKETKNGSKKDSKKAEKPDQNKQGEQKQPGKDDDKGKTNKDADTAAGSQAEAPAPEIHVPGESLDDLNARWQENERLAAQALIKMGNNEMVQEVFGDPDAYVILYTSMEQQEGSAKRMNQEDPAAANTGGEKTSGAGDQT